jgi:periplasmic protein CpxP/Spy
MIKNLVLTLALAGLVYCVTPSFAQDDTAPAQDTVPHSGPPEHGHGNFDPARRADMLAKHLQLSSDQQAKVLDILKSAQSQMEGLRSDASTPREEKHSKVMEIRKNANDQIRALLDTNQQEKFDQMQSRHQERQGHHGNGQPQGSPDSAEQK